MFKNILLVGLGGAIGSILRYVISFMIKKQLIIDYQPIATMIINFLGSFIIGYGMHQMMKNNWQDSLNFLIIIGFCGGFTTFSTFAYENFIFLQNHQLISFITYTLLSVIFCISGVYIGYFVVDKIN